MITAQRLKSKEFWARSEGDGRKFRPVAVPQARVTIMDIEKLESLQEQINELAEAGVQNAITFLNELNDFKHERLKGLLGGDENGHCYLTKEQHDKTQYWVRDGISHKELKRLLGGDAEGHYHLTEELLNKLKNVPAKGVKGDKGDAGDSASIQIIDHLYALAMAEGRTSALSALMVRVLRLYKLDKDSVEEAEWIFTLENGSTLKKVMLSTGKEHEYEAGMGA